MSAPAMNMMAPGVGLSKPASDGALASTKPADRARTPNRTGKP